MKKSELKFKCVVPNKNAGIRIRLALKSIRLIKNAEDDYTHYQFFAYDRGIVATTNAECFCLLQEPLMSYEDAIKLIESIKPDAPEFDIKPFDKIIYRQDTHHTSIWAPGIFSHIAHNAAWSIGDGKSLLMFAKYKDNEKFVGARGFKENPEAYPAGWWQCKNGKPAWVKRDE